MEQNSKTQQNETLLNAIYHTCNLSIHSIEDVITSAKNKEFQSFISKIHSQYELIKKECELLAKSQDISLCPVDCVIKFKTWVVIKLSTLLDCSTAYLAKLLYGGTACEIAEIIQKTAECDLADKDTLALSEKLQSLQEKHIHELKKYLSVKEEPKKEKE